MLRRAMCDLKRKRMLTVTTLITQQTHSNGLMDTTHTLKDKPSEEGFTAMPLKKHSGLSKEPFSELFLKEPFNDLRDFFHYKKPFVQWKVPSVQKRPLIFKSVD